MSWAKGHDQCATCGTTERKHWAKGLCARCYKQVNYEEKKHHIKARHKRWNLQNADAIAERSKAWAKANKDKVRETNQKWRSKFWKYQVGETVYLHYAGFWCEGVVVERPNRNLRTVRLKGGTVLDVSPRLLKKANPKETA